MNLENKKILITGGASGIGLAIAKQMSDLGNHVIICGRNRERLEAASEKYGFEPIVCDVTIDQDQIELCETLQDRHGNLDILINNAGMMAVYHFLKDPKTLEMIDQEIALNCIAPLKLTSRALPLLQKSAEPAIVFVSSGTAYTPSPMSLVYTGTKSLIHHFAESLRVQLQPSGIKVFEILPPPTDTDLADTVKSKVDVSRFRFMKPEAVAVALTDGMRADKFEIPVGLSRLMKLMSRTAPRILFKQMSKTIPG